MTTLAAAAAAAAAAAHPACVPVPLDLEYTSDGLAGGYGAVRSWSHLAALAGRVEAGHGRWVIVQRRDDPGRRFAQFLRTTEAIIVEVGALDATTGRHTVWRLRADDPHESPFDADRFHGIARDWLSIGVVPGYSAATILLDGDDEPF